jgi:putative addiction module CopG family antidote
MDVTLSAEMQLFVQEKLKAGRYATPQDVVHAGLAALMQQEELVTLPPKELQSLYPQLREKVDAGLREAREGKLSDGEEFFDELEREERDRDDPELPGSRKTA